MSGAPNPTAAVAELYERSLDCVHCGLCLPVCPTYRETGRETSSPRGRIYLMRGLAEGRLSLGDALSEEAFLCLGCRACETACPSGVEFGHMIEVARAEVDAAGLRTGARVWLERRVLRSVIPHRRRVRLAVNLLAVAERLNLVRLLRPLLPAKLRDVSDLLPPVPPRRERARPPEVVPAEGTRRGRVGFFAGCIMPELFGPVNAATVRVLARNGFDVVTPPGQGCCGALHRHAGDAAYAQRLLEKNVRAFADAGVDAVVMNSAGCGAALREADRWLPEAAPLARSIRDVCEFLDEVGFAPPTGRLELRVCYDDPCHLVHAQQVQSAPRNLLRAIPGVTLVEHADAAGCCGAAGTYNLTHPEMSAAVLDRKMRSLEAAAPDVIATGNPGCLMQLRAGALRRGLRARVAHPVELLDDAYQGSRTRGPA